MPFFSNSFHYQDQYAECYPDIGWSDMHIVLKLDTDCMSFTGGPSANKFNCSGRFYSLWITYSIFINLLSPILEHSAGLHVNLSSLQSVFSEYQTILNQKPNTMQLHQQASWWLKCFCTIEYTQFWQCESPWSHGNTSSHLGLHSSITLLVAKYSIL